MLAKLCSPTNKQIKPAVKKKKVYIETFLEKLQYILFTPIHATLGLEPITVFL